MGMRTYKFTLLQKANPTGVTQLQIQAAAAIPIVIIRAWVSQSTSTTSGVGRVEIVRKTAAATVTAAVIATDIRPFDPDDAASQVQVSTTATGYTATGEGTDGDVLYQDNFNILNGWLWLPVPEERIWVKGGGIIALKYPASPPAATYDCGIIFAEVG
jgi:hypothetical protein